MLSEEILALARKKYEKTGEIYSKSLEVTLKIFSVLKKGDFGDAPSLFEERDSLLLASQNLISEVEALLKQLFNQEKVSTGRLEDLPAAFSDDARALCAAKSSLRELIGKIKETDAAIGSLLSSEAVEIKNRIRAAKTTRSVNGKYRQADFQSNIKLTI